MNCLKGMEFVMRKLYLLPLIALFALALAACGGDDKPEPTATPVPAAAAPAEAAAAPAQAAADAQPVAAAAGNADHGKQIYSQICIACHGPEAKGVQGLGKDLTTSTFVAERNDADMVAFLKVGRDPGDPLNTTGVAMPPKGGNPALSDQDLLDIVAFVRTIHQ
jgi:mono/diheme cytochrome c family protein